MTNKIFDSTNINGLNIKNRIWRSATWEGACDQSGEPTPRTIEYYEQLAKGGVGLIISGYTYVSKEGQQQPGMAGIDSDRLAPGYRALTDVVHLHGGKVVCQLVHAGGQAIAANSGFAPVAPSAITVKQFPERPSELHPTQIDQLVSAFATAARRAKEWGFDGVQLHGAHGYLLNQFLSPLTNRRTDEYGGSLANRARIMLRVVDAIGQTVGRNFPLLVKLNLTDHLEGGLSEQEGVAAAVLLDQAGVDAIEVSSGTAASGSLSPARKVKGEMGEGYNLCLARLVRGQVSCKVATVGGFRSLNTIEQAIASGQTDYVSLCRPLIWEPGLVSRWQQGDRAPARCVSCSRCFIPGMKGGITCVTRDRILNRTVS